MRSLGRRLTTLLLLAAAALAANGIEVLSHTDVKSGIEVLCGVEGGSHVHALVLVNKKWVLVDTEKVVDGRAAVIFPTLLADEARLVLRDGGGAVVADLTYDGDELWYKTP